MTKNNLTLTRIVQVTATMSAFSKFAFWAGWKWLRTELQLSEQDKPFSFFFGNEAFCDLVMENVVSRELPESMNWFVKQRTSTKMHKTKQKQWSQGFWKGEKVPDRFGKLGFLASFSIRQPGKHKIFWLVQHLYPSRKRGATLFHFYFKASKHFLCLHSCFKTNSEECSGPL